MADYKKYINALRKCAKEHDNDTTYTGHIRVSDLCRDTADLLEELKQEPCEDAVSRKEVTQSRPEWLSEDVERDTDEQTVVDRAFNRGWNSCLKEFLKNIKELPSITPQPFINKPCVSEGVCREDKIQVIDKIRAEIEQLTIAEGGDDYIRKMAELFSLKMKVLHIIDKYKAESEDK